MHNKRGTCTIVSEYSSTVYLYGISLRTILIEITVPQIVPRQKTKLFQVLITFFML